MFDTFSEFFYTFRTSEFICSVNVMCYILGIMFSFKFDWQKAGYILRRIFYIVGAHKSLCVCIYHKSKIFGNYF